MTATAREVGDKFATGSGYTLPYQKGDRHPIRLSQEKGFDLSNAKGFTKDQVIPTIEEIMNKYGNGSRAIVSGWYEWGDGHVFFAENVGGKIQFYDPQNGDMNCRSYFKEMTPHTIDLFRIDDLPFNELVFEVLRNDVV